MRSLSLKFIIIISILMAFVLALQFYFTNQTQQDVLSELNKLTHYINRTTDQILVDGPDFKFRKNMEWVDSVSVPDVWENIEPVPELNEDISEDIFITKEDKNVIWLGEKNRPYIVKTDELDSIANKEKNVFRSFRELPKSNYNFSRIFPDSMVNKMQSIEIDLNFPHPGHEKVKAFVTDRNFTSVKPPVAGKDVISFNVLNFASEKAPRVVKYNYNTRDFSSALNDIRDRNILITLALFGVSIIAVAAIAGRFIKPIKSLNNSFDKVVQGDLDVKVISKSHDEIGELSNSFNHMVNELRKNRDKEAAWHRQERLASLGQLAAGVAHEIRNPLNAINLTIEHLNDKFISKDEKQARQYIESIQKEIRRLDKTVNNFLSYLRSENLNREEVDVNDLLKEILTLYEREISQNKIQLNENFDTACIFNLDRERFKTVLMNVIINAIQAMEKGGIMQVSTSQAEKSITISDTGTGIAAAHLENIFDLFYTTKSAGTGLGLPTAYKIVKEHDGEIFINSEQGKGTQVIISLAAKV